MSDAFLVVCRHVSLLAASELAALRALIAAGAEPHAAPASGRADALARSALAILDTEYRHHQIRATDVASRLHVTHWHLSRVLRRTTGQSFLAHLHRRRVAAAGQLLVSGTDASSIKEIAYEVGYSSTRELDRRFRRATGMTPGEYRRCYRTLTMRGAERRRRFLPRVS